MAHEAPGRRCASESKGPQYFLETGYVAFANHERQWVLKSRMILFSAWNGRTNSKRRFGEVGEKHVDKDYNSSWPSLSPNKLVERTLPRCALQRRSPAR